MNRSWISVCAALLLAAQAQAGEPPRREVGPLRQNPLRLGSYELADLSFNVREVLATLGEREQLAFWVVATPEGERVSGIEARTAKPEVSLFNRRGARLGELPLEVLKRPTNLVVTEIRRNEGPGGGQLWYRLTNNRSTPASNLTFELGGNALATPGEFRPVDWRLAPHPDLQPMSGVLWRDAKGFLIDDERLLNLDHGDVSYTMKGDASEVFLGDRKIFEALVGERVTVLARRVEGGIQARGLQDPVLADVTGVVAESGRQLANPGSPSNLPPLMTQHRSLGITPPTWAEGRVLPLGGEVSLKALVGKQVYLQAWVFKDDAGRARRAHVLRKQGLMAWSKVDNPDQRRSVGDWYFVEGLRDGTARVRKIHDNEGSRGHSGPLEVPTRDLSLTPLGNSGLVDELKR